ncbi:CLUMA_CG004041, isoform A [Clunio marinus]|uniref:CLUMA_CG004041, isoform A n=1 Tax=Clunio marinus TaxID=568069 RepID=A0A1J1HUX3_9DIPT|nr:CLUMA_CG004041, isoform A [Clunio marinus]
MEKSVAIKNSSVNMASNLQSLCFQQCSSRKNIVWKDINHVLYVPKTSFQTHKTGRCKSLKIVHLLHQLCHKVLAIFKLNAA